MPFAPAFCQMQKKKKERIMFFSPSLLSWNRKKERIPSLLSEKKKEKAVRFPSPLLENRQKEKERRTLPFLLHSFPYRRRNGGSPPPFPEKRKKEKDEKTEERRQKEEGQKQKGTERREKEKEARERKPEKRQRGTPQKGAFLTRESRKRTGRGFPSGSRKRVWERHFSPHDRDDGWRMHLPAFPLPIRISKHGKSGEPYFALFPLSPSWHERLLPSPSLSFFLCISVFVCGLL